VARAAVLVLTTCLILRMDITHWLVRADAARSAAKCKVL
jgi:hypothetical protein